MFFYFVEVYRSISDAKSTQKFLLESCSKNHLLFNFLPLGTEFPKMSFLFVLKEELDFKTLFGLSMIYNKTNEMLEHQFQLYKQEKILHGLVKSLIQ